MALNPFFLQGSPSEQRLVQELIDEHLKIFGIDVYYLPRKMIETDDVLGEVQSSKFNDAYVLEAYLNNYEGYAKGSDIMTKFGVNLENDPSLSSASTTIHSPFPSLALLLQLLIIPPFITVGSKSAPSSIDATKEVVVVFPCVPAIAIDHLSRINSHNISALCTIGIRLLLASKSSTLFDEIAVETTTIFAS